METRVIVLRHATSAAPERILGHETDLSLGPQGVKQAEALALHLETLGPKALYCSGMRRAMETAAPIAAVCQLEPRVVTELHERKMGSLSGKPRVNVLRDYLEVQERWMAGDIDFTNPGGESYRQIRDRVVPAFYEVLEQSKHSFAVVVTHGLVIRVLLTTILDALTPRDLDKIGIDCTAMNDLLWDGRKFRILALNQRAPGVH